MRWYICIWPSIQRSLYAAWSSEAYQECLQTYAMRNHKLLFMCIAWRKAWHYNGLYSFIKFQETWFRNLKENRQSKNALFWKETLRKLGIHFWMRNDQAIPIYDTDFTAFYRHSGITQPLRSNWLALLTKTKKEVK